MLSVPSMIPSTQLKHFLSVARHAAQWGGQRALKYFKTRLPVIQKIDRSPVTRADREAEKVIRGVLAKACPSHQLCGEEFGWDEKEKSEYRWWIDPVDGTRQFIRGIPFWGTLVALEYRGEVVAGVIYHPVLKLTLWASKGQGCYTDSAHSTSSGQAGSPQANGTRVHVSRIPNLKGGTLTYGGLRLTPQSYRKRLTDLIATCYDDRGFGDCYGHSNT